MSFLRRLRLWRVPFTTADARCCLAKRIGLDCSNVSGLPREVFGHLAESRAQKEKDSNKLVMPIVPRNLTSKELRRDSEPDELCWDQVEQTSAQRILLPILIPKFWKSLSWNLERAHERSMRWGSCTLILLQETHPQTTTSLYSHTCVLTYSLVGEERPHKDENSMAAHTLEVRRNSKLDKLLDETNCYRLRNRLRRCTISFLEQDFERVCPGLFHAALMKVVWTERHEGEFDWKKLICRSQEAMSCQSFNQRLCNCRRQLIEISLPQAVCSPPNLPHSLGFGRSMAWRYIGASHS